MISGVFIIKTTAANYWLVGVGESVGEIDSADWVL